MTFSFPLTMGVTCTSYSSVWELGGLWNLSLSVPGGTNGGSMTTVFPGWEGVEQSGSSKVTQTTLGFALCSWQPTGFLGLHQFVCQREKPD
jgi:hypothetical protein